MGVIVIVEDSIMQRQMMKRFLEKKGHEVESLGSGPECLAFLQEEDDIDCIVTDYQMPQMTGEELIRQIRSLNTSVPILVCTADVQPEVHQRLKEAGASGLLEKPVNLKKLEEMIDLTAG